MAQQRLHQAMAPIDVLTKIEHEEVMHKGMDRALRMRFEGIEAQRFPRVIVQATATTVFLFPPSGEAIIGPEEGDFWLIRRAIVVSSGFLAGDTAKYILFRGSTPSDTAGGYGPLNYYDGMVSTGGAVGQAVGVGFSPANKAGSMQPGEQLYALVTGATVGNTYILSGEAIRCPAEMKGKILS